jgi:AraC-like DNA-binding protein
VESSTEANYCLFTTDAPVNWAHNGHDENLDAGDMVLLGQGEHDSFMEPSGFRSNILILPTHWLESWLPDPSALVGRTISKESEWGQVLSPLIHALTPEVAVAPPLPPSVLVDQLGTTLAMVADESETQAMSDLVRRAQLCIRERCREPQLTAADVATSLDVPTPTLHRALRVKELTFVSQLLEARFDVALQMLSSSLYARLTTAEIARQCGFMRTSHFARVVSRRTGHTPCDLRRLSPRGP